LTELEVSVRVCLDQKGPRESKEGLDPQESMEIGVNLGLQDLRVFKVTQEPQGTLETKDLKGLKETKAKTAAMGRKAGLVRWVLWAFGVHQDAKVQEDDV
jgi:hypothetical protein